MCVCVLSVSLLQLAAGYNGTKALSVTDRAVGGRGSGV